MKPKHVIAIAVLAATFPAGVVAVTISVLASRGIYEYQGEAEFSALPTSDAALESWLRSQPGVLTSSVIRNGNTVKFEYEIRKGNDLPDLEHELESLGYLDCTRRVEVAFDGR